ncbi:hypothetical protein D3C86_1843600 [compost metagenome]
MRPLLANARSRPGKPAGAKGFFVDDFDGCVMGRVFGQVDEVVLFHGIRNRMQTDMGMASPEKGVGSISVVAGFPRRS